MILLTDIAQKVENILNGTDTEVNDSSYSPTYIYRVKTQGYHLDHIIEESGFQGKNFIPVFIEQMSGSYNPVPLLKQMEKNVAISIYFPVRFKEHFYALEDKLVDWFVGQVLTFGGQQAICNISIANYGEIVDLDLRQFKSWVEYEYQLPIDTNEAWLSMTFNLYISTAGDDYIWGNSAHISLSATIDDTIVEDEDITFAENAVQSQSNASNEQILDTKEAQGLAFGTVFGSSFAVYVKNDDFYRAVITEWFNGTLQNTPFTLTLTIGDEDDTENEPLTFTRTCYVENCNLSVKKGELMTMTFSFIPMISDDEDEDE